MRIILFTGKGGVGKTSVSAATACKIAASGKKVLVLSTDQAHSLGDAFGQKLSSEPQNIMNNLDAMEIDAVEECERVWGGIKDYIKRFLTSRSEETLETEELLVFPGFEELISLMKIKEIYDKKEYDVLIVDCAPTGETLSLLKYPDMLSDWINQILPIKRKTVKVAGPAVEKVMKIPMPEDSIFDEIEVLCNKLQSLKEVMENKDELSIRIVTTPEKIVIQEAKRNFSFLHLYDYNVDAVIVNKIYPKEALNGYFKRWMTLQEEALTEIKESFLEIPVFLLELQKQEICTAKRLQEAANLLYQDKNPEEILFRDTIFEVGKQDGKDCFSVTVPFFDNKDMDLLQKGNELLLIIQNQRRRFLLPAKLARKEIVGARYRDGKMNILFE